MDLSSIYAYRRKGVVIQTAYFDRLHTAGFERVNRFLSALRGALRANSAVVLIFNLQYARHDLEKLAVTLGAQSFIGWPIGMNGSIQSLGIGADLVEADIQRRLGVVVITQVAHAQ